MQDHHARLALTLLIGVSLGAATGYFTNFSRCSTAPVTETIPTFDDAQFAKSADVDSRLILARQLPSADAAKCASLAKAMLTKSVVSVSYVGDPFAVPPSEEIRNAPLPEVAWEGLFKRWMQVAPLAAWDFVVAHHSEELPLRESALKQWASIDTLAAASAAGDDITEEEKMIIVLSSTEHDPASGLALVLKWTLNLTKEISDPFSSLDNYIENLLTSLAKKSPRLALEWCEANTPDRLSAVCIGWSRNNPAAYLEWIKSRPVKEQQDIMVELCDQPDVTASYVRYIATLSNAEQVKNIILDALVYIANRDETLSQELIDELLPNPTDRMVARADICDKLRQIDPRKAMDFILPSLRTAMPLFEIPIRQNWGCFGSGFPTTSSPTPDCSSMSNAFGSYIELGPAAGVGKTEVLQMLGQFHPQYLPWMLQENIYGLSQLLGPPAQWLQPFVANATREEIANITDSFYYKTTDQALQDAKSLAPGVLRDTIIESAVEMMLDADTPVAEVMNQINKLGNNQVDLSGIYFAWMDSDPAAAMKHFAEDKDHTHYEWDSMIRKGQEQYFEQIQTMAEKLPPGELRNDVAKSLGTKALETNHDYVTSMYWATEITTKEQRSEQIRDLLDDLQKNRTAAQNKDLIAGIRSNIENSSLSALEKARWLERIETEVAP
jgi:hypothetical protein